jgi:hypothetical protein
VLTKAAQAHTPKPAPIRSVTGVLSSATVRHGASAAFSASGYLTAAFNINRPLRAPFLTQPSVGISDPVITRGIAASLGITVAVAGTASTTFAISLSLHPFTDVPNSAARVSRGMACALLVKPSANVIPAFQYLMQPETKTFLPPKKQTADKVTGLKVDIKITPALGGVIGFAREAAVKIKAVAKTLTPNGVSSTFSATITCEATMESPAQTQSFTARPRMSWSLQRHRVTASVSNSIKLALHARTNVDAALLGPGGKLTQITKKKKLRIESKKHPEHTGEHPRYFWSLVADNESCGCEFVHIGIYDIRKGPWKFNQENEVMLLMADILPDDPFKTPVLFPQYNDNGNYRIVKVLNLMYDIQPPATFTRTEFVYNEYVERQYIATEIPRFVFVYEGCGGSFFLINAECE